MAPIRRLWRTDDGAMAPLFAVALAGMAGFAALAVDGAQVFTSRIALQSIADSSAIAGALQLPDDITATGDAIHYADRNKPAQWDGEVLTDKDVDVGIWDEKNRRILPGGGTPDAIKVTVRRDDGDGRGFRLAFGSVLDKDEVELQATAVARARYTATCFLALRQSGRGIDMSSNSRFTADGCDVRVNSTGTDSIRGAANVSFTTNDGNACTAGWVSGRPQDFSPMPGENCGAMDDPLADLPEPAVGPCDHDAASYRRGTHTLSPGVYCNGITVRSNTTIDLTPGLYVIDGGTLSLNSNTTISGEGVTIFLANGATLDFRSNTTIDLSGRKAGSTEGILFFQSRTYATTHSIRSNSVLRLEGTIYMPTGSLDLASNSDFGVNASSHWTAMVVYDVNLSSNSDLTLLGNYRDSDVPLPPELRKVSASLVR